MEDNPGSDIQDLLFSEGQGFYQRIRHGMLLAHGQVRFGYLVTCGYLGGWGGDCWRCGCLLGHGSDHQIAEIQGDHMQAPDSTRICKQAQFPSLATCLLA